MPTLSTDTGLTCSHPHTRTSSWCSFNSWVCLQRRRQEGISYHNPHNAIMEITLFNTLAFTLEWILQWIRCTDAITENQSCTGGEVSLELQTQRESPPQVAPLSTGWHCGCHQFLDRGLLRWNLHCCCETVPPCGKWIALLGEIYSIWGHFLHRCWMVNGLNL